MNKTAYFDNAATTFPKPNEVYDFMDNFYREYGGNVGRGQYKMASVINNLVADTRKLLQKLFHCPNKKVVFTHSATEALNIILQGLPIIDHCNIYLSPFEHNAVTRVINHMQSIYRLNIYTLAVDNSSLTYDLEKIKYQFSENKPNVVVISHASNVCGVVAPIDEICKLSKGYEAINVIDMSQTAGLIDTDLSSNAIDFAVFAGHKTLYGPFGVGGFICSGTMKPLPLIYGGTGVDSASLDMPDSIPERYEVASPNIMAISGLHAALKWIAKVGIKCIYEKEETNRKLLLEILSQYKEIKIITPSEHNTTIGVVSCLFDGYSSDSIGQILSEQDVAVRTGLHCAPFAHKFLGTFPAGTVRFSVSYFNDYSDFEMLEKAIQYFEENA